MIMRKFFIISGLILVLACSVFPQSSGCDDCPKPLVDVYGVKVNVPMPPPDDSLGEYKTVNSQQALYNWVALGDAQISMGQIKKNDPERDCVNWLDGSMEQAVLANPDTTFKAHLQNWSTGEIPQDGPVPGIDFVIWSSIDSSGGKYHFYVYLEDAHTRTRLAEGEADFTDPNKVQDAALQAISQIEPVFDKVRAYQKNMRNLGGDDIAIHAKIKVIPAESEMKGNETISVTFKVYDCDGTPLANRWVKISATNGHFDKDSMQTNSSGQFTAYFTANNSSGAADLKGIYYPYHTPSFNALGAWKDTTVNINISPVHNWTLYITASHTETQDTLEDDPTLGFYLWHKINNQHANVIQHVIGEFFDDSVYIDEVAGASGTVENDFTFHVLSGPACLSDSWVTFKGNNYPGTDFAGDFKLSCFNKSQIGVFFTYVIETYEYDHYWGYDECGTPVHRDTSYSFPVAYSGGTDYYLHTQHDPQWFYNLGEGPTATWTKVDSGYIFKGHSVHKYYGDIGPTLVVEDSVTVYARPYNVTTGINSAADNTIPKEYGLFQNYPNPFNPVTKIRYSIPYVRTHRDASVRINVYDILGRKIATLVNEKQRPGNYEVTFDGSELASGIYFYTLNAGNFHQTKKLILLK